MDFLNATLWQFRTWHNILCRAKEVAYIRSLSLDLHFLLLKHPSKIVTMLPFCYLRHIKYCTTSVCQGCMRIRNLSFYSYSTVPPLDRRSFPFLSCARERVRGLFFFEGVHRRRRGRIASIFVPFCFFFYFASIFTVVCGCLEKCICLASCESERESLLSLRFVLQ